MDPRLRNKLATFLGLFAIICIVWILSGPWIARHVYTQEKALSTYIDTQLDKEPLLLEAFTRIKDDIESIKGSNSTSVIANYVKDHLGKVG